MARSSASRRAAILIASLVLAAVLAEIGVRLAGYRPHALEASLFVPLDDELARFGLRPGWKGLFCGKPVTIDADGRRIVPRAVAPPAGSERRRVLLVGDSVVFGFCVADDETIAAQLQAAFDAKGAEIDVANVGVPAYSSRHELGALRGYLTSSSADHVVVLWVANDAAVETDPLGLERARADSTLSELLGWTARHWYSAHLVATSVTRTTPSSAEEPALRARQELSAAELERSLEALLEMRSLARRHGAVFSVGVYFGPTMLNEQGQPTRWTRRVLAQMSEAGLEPFQVATHARELPLSELRVSLNDAHPSPKAIALVAADIERELERVRLSPSP